MVQSIGLLIKKKWNFKIGIKNQKKVFQSQFAMVLRTNLNLKKVILFTFDLK